MLLAVFRCRSEHLAACMSVSFVFCNRYLKSNKEKLLHHPIYMYFVLYPTVCKLFSSTKCYSGATELVW